MRAGLNRQAIADCAEAMEAGAEFPPIVVLTKAGGRKWAADGFHRVLARKKTGVKTIEAKVRHGGRREAVPCAAGANATHGVRRTAEDKRKAVVTFLSDRKWAGWADAEIARICSVSPSQLDRGKEGGHEQGPQR